MAYARLICTDVLAGEDDIQERARAWPDNGLAHSSGRVVSTRTTSTNCWTLLFVSVPTTVWQGRGSVAQKLAPSCAIPSASRADTILRRSASALSACDDAGRVTAMCASCGQLRWWVVCWGE